MLRHTRFRVNSAKMGHEQGNCLPLALGCGISRRQASLQACQQLLDISRLGQLRLKVCGLLGSLRYDAVIAAIKSLNGWAKVHKSFWYVHTALTADQVFHLLDYAQEFAWREDVRTRTEVEKLKDLVKRVFSCGLSRWWRGYWQGHHRAGEFRVES